MTTTAPTPAPTQTDTEHRVSIVGGGASGVLTAANLLADPDPRLRVTIHESAPVLGAGIAYGTTDPRHLLNVRARHMSAFPDTPSDLIDWYRATGRTIDPIAFLPRCEYAAYLRDRLADVADDRLHVVTGRVSTTSSRRTAGYRIVSERQRVRRRRHGRPRVRQLRPRRPLTVDGDELPPATWHVDNPWDLTWIERLPDDAVVVLVGSGLTAIDTAITVLEDAARSPGRHDQPPRAAARGARRAAVDGLGEPGARGSADRRPARDVLRPPGRGRPGTRTSTGARSSTVSALPTQSIWQRLDLDERRRFLARYSRHWEVRRHRMAPEIGARLAGVPPRRPTPADDRRRSPGSRRATAPAGSSRRRSPQKIARRRRRQLHRPADRHHPQPQPAAAEPARAWRSSPRRPAPRLSCLPSGEVLDAAGEVVPRMYAVGPPRKGTLYESTAIPEIRAQAVAGLSPRSRRERRRCRTGIPARS